MIYIQKQNIKKGSNVSTNMKYKNGIKYTNIKYYNKIKYT